MKATLDCIWDEDFVEIKRSKLSDHELDELREHIELSFNIGKVYYHAKERSRKEHSRAKINLKRKLHHSYKNEKIRI